MGLGTVTSIDVDGELLISPDSGAEYYAWPITITRPRPRQSIAFRRRLRRGVGSASPADAVLANPDPYLAHAERLAALPEPEQEKMAAWHALQEDIHDIRYGPAIYRRSHDWEPPEDFEIFPRPR